MTTWGLSDSSIPGGDRPEVAKHSGLKGFCRWIKEEGGRRRRGERRGGRAASTDRPDEAEEYDSSQGGLASSWNDKSGSEIPAGSQRGGGRPRGHLVIGKRSAWYNMDRGYYWHLVGRSWAWSSQPFVPSTAPSKRVLTPGSF